MRKSILGALIGSAFALAGPAHAGLVLDLDGAGGLAPVEVTALDWSQTSFLAQGANNAIVNFATQNGGSTEFQVYTHAKLTGYTLANGGSSGTLPPNFGEITLVAGYTERVVGVGPGLTSATFATTGAGWLEIYYSAPSGTNATDLTGNGFNDGRLIGKLSGITVDAFGNFTITSAAAVLDGFNGNDYTGQQTVRGFGSQEAITAGTDSIALDPTFFLTTLTGFTINFANISIGLPYTSVNPSDCFNTTQNGAAVGSTGHVSTCDNVHVDGTYAANGGSGGYTPVVGNINGGTPGAPDFIAQTDFNSAVTGDVPEPGTLALVGLALGTAGFAASRRRRG
ncbi:PEP-CTERM sorting domain-containing protein [Rubrivivax sp. JA1026]|uniref:PEP-CTERM sorting domain-containing protein n=1 Tax=Rubrivivax sp. JA1026 TaxID=2710888 RepID=UPI0013E993B1|nr:PEP-CTERM sorting domain-containing protein [Rubrivivax sp. JA1026]